MSPTRLLLFALLLAHAAASGAQGFPGKPLRFIVPFSPGGGNDTVAREIAQQMAIGLGQPVVVENRPGAGGTVGAEIAAKSAPDGYTLFLGGVGSHAVNPNLRAKLPYDPVKDFAPVALIATASSVLVVHPSMQASGIAEFTALARSHPGRINYASNGTGSSAHLAAVLYESMTGARMVHVPYKGLSPALVDLLGGEVHAMFSSMVAIVPHIRTGRLRALAVTGRRRSALLPEVPTLAETIAPGYEAGSWYGILVPAGTPRDVVVRLNAEVAKALGQQEVRKRLAAEGAEAVGGTPEEFAAHIHAELARMGTLIRQAGIRME